MTVKSENARDYYSKFTICDLPRVKKKIESIWNKKRIGSEKNVDKRITENTQSHSVLTTCKCRSRNACLPCSSPRGGHRSGTVSSPTRRPCLLSTLLHNTANAMGQEGGKNKRQASATRGNEHPRGVIRRDQLQRFHTRSAPAASHTSTKPQKNSQAETRNSQDHTHTRTRTHLRAFLRRRTQEAKKRHTPSTQNHTIASVCMHVVTAAVKYRQILGTIPS